MRRACRARATRKGRVPVPFITLTFPSPRCSRPRSAVPSRCASPPAMKAPPSARWCGRSSSHSSPRPAATVWWTRSSCSTTVPPTTRRRRPSMPGPGSWNGARAAGGRVRPWRPLWPRRAGTWWSSSTPMSPTRHPPLSRACSGPLLYFDDVTLVKGFYDRPLHGDPTGGGRVTELVARPGARAALPRAVRRAPTTGRRDGCPPLGLREVRFRRRIRRRDRPPDRRGPASRCRAAWPRSTSACGSIATARCTSCGPRPPTCCAPRSHAPAAEPRGHQPIRFWWSPIAGRSPSASTTTARSTSRPGWGRTGLLHRATARRHRCRPGPR